MKTPSDIIRSAAGEGRKALFEHEAKDIARAVGISVPEFAVAPPGDDRALLSAAEKIGFPIALKAISPHIIHKSDAGAVLLDIANGNALSVAIPQMNKTITERTPRAVIQYFMIEKMMPPGLELLVGGLRDEQFGPSVAFGLGGVWVESLKDAVFGIMPMTRQETLKMMNETKAAMFLKGFRGSPPLDQDAAISMINAVGKLITDFPEISEVDLNPVRLYTEGAVALDVRVILR